MLKAIAKFFERVALWLFGPSHHMRLIDGWPRIVRTVNSVDTREPFFHPAVINGARMLMYVSKMPKDGTWRVHAVRNTNGKELPYVELIGMADGEWLRIKEHTTNVEVSKAVLANSFYPALARLPDDAWNKLDIESIEMIMKDVIIDRWKQYPEHFLGIIIRTFHYKMPYNQDGVEGLYSAIDGMVFVNSDGNACFATYVSDDYFNSLPVKEEYVIEVDFAGERLVYTISDCPEDWCVHKIAHECGEITYLRSIGDRHCAYRRMAIPGSYIQAMEPEQRKAVLSEWEIPKPEVDELQRIAHMSAAEVLDPVPVEFDIGDDEDVTKLADELYGPSSGTAERFSQKYSNWDRIPKWADKKFHATEQREWTFLIEIDQFPLNCEVAYVIPGQYRQDGPIEALVAFRPIGGGPTVVCPFHCPVVEMRPVNNVHPCGDEYRTGEIVVLSRGWRYVFRDQWLPKDYLVTEARLVRNNPTGKPLITFEYTYASGPMVGKIVMRRFVVPTVVTRAGSNNKRKAGKRQRGTGKRR